MRINQNAPVQQAQQMFIQANPETVWSVLADINGWITWNKRVVRVAMSTTPAVGATFSWSANGARLKSVLHTVEPARAIGWTGTTFGGSAIHNWRLEPQAGGTLVKVEESMEGWLVGLFKSKMNRDLEQDMRFWLECLKARSEQ